MILGKTLNSPSAKALVTRFGKKASVEAAVSWTDLKDTDDKITVRSRDFGKNY